jgi:hypothetical protein
VLYSGPDTMDLNLSSWNCSSGFLNQTKSIVALTKGKGKVISLASHDDSKAYVQWSTGGGLSEIEQWNVPSTARDEWEVSGQVKGF